MYSAILTCMACGCKGRIGFFYLTDEEPTVSKDFHFLGSSKANGCLHLLCDRCRTVLMVDPLHIFSSGLTAQPVKGVVCNNVGLLLKSIQNGASNPEKNR